MSRRQTGAASTPTVRRPPVTPEHRDPEDGMTDQEAADALFDAVMEGRGRENVTLERLREAWEQWPHNPDTDPEEAARRYIHALEQRVAEVERENRQQRLDWQKRQDEYERRMTSLVTENNRRIEDWADQTKRAEQAEAERDEARRERDWMYEWFDNLYPRDADLCLERYRAAHPEAGR